MIRTFEKRTGSCYEVQFYTKDGDAAHVVNCDTVAELAQYLARSCWGNNLADWDAGQLPTIWKDGRRWCFGEYSEY